MLAIPVINGVMRLDLPKWEPTRTQLQALKELRVPVYTPRGGRSAVELYDHAVKRLRWLPKDRAREYATALFGPEAWRDFYWLR